MSNSVILSWLWRFALVENCSSLEQYAPNLVRERVRVTEHAPHDPCRLLERRHGLAEIVERGAGVLKPGPPSRRLARSKSGAIVDESRAGVHDDLMRVPGKPLGFFAASTIEYHPARPEAHRSTVLGGAEAPQLAAAEASRVTGEG